MRQRIDCQRCHQRLRPAATDRSLCERCAGEPVLHECRLCRAQSDSYDQGRCPACGLRERLDQLRAEADPEALARLEPYLAALAASPNPWSTVRWMRTRRSYQTLRMLARGGVDLSHEALDAAGGGPSIEHLRDALVAQGVLSPRAEQTAAFDRAAVRLLARLPEGEDRTKLRAYASWRQRQHLLLRERRNQTTRGSMRHELARLRAAVQLAAWAHDHGQTLKAIDQHELDRWLDRGPVARRRVADFLDWAARAGYRGSLVVPPVATRRHTDQLATEERLALSRRLLDDDTLDLRDRFGGLLVMLLAQPASRLLMLTTDHLASDDGQVTMRLGPDPLELPGQLGRLVARLADRADTWTDGDGGPCWLFRGARRAAPLGEQQFCRRLRRLGIPTLAGRTGALLGLAATVPPAILADLLGLSEGSAASWSRLAGGDWARYAANGPEPLPAARDRVSAPEQGP